MTATQTTARETRHIARLMDIGTGDARRRFLVIEEVSTGSWIRAARIRLTEGSRGRGTWREINVHLESHGLAAKGWKAFSGANELRSSLISI